MRPFALLRRAAAIGAAAALAVLLGLAACNDATDPLEIDTYPYKIVIRSDTASYDSLAFRWPSAAQPVTYWVEDAGGLRDMVDLALQRWAATAKSGRFRGTIVADSAAADVLVFLRQPPAPEFAAMRLGSFFARDCEGAADILITPETKEVAIPMHVYVFTPFDPAEPAIHACLDATTTHEIGHTIGLFQHSPDTTDVMYRLPVHAVPSYRDAATVQTLYMHESDLAAVRH